MLPRARGRADRNCRRTSRAHGAGVRGRARCLRRTRILHASCGPRFRRDPRFVAGPLTAAFTIDRSPPGRSPPTRCLLLSGRSAQTARSCIRVGRTALTMLPQAGAGGPVAPLPARDSGRQGATPPSCGRLVLSALVLAAERISASDLAVLGVGGASGSPSTLGGAGSQARAASESQNGRVSERRVFSLDQWIVRPAWSCPGVIAPRPAGLLERLGRYAARLDLASQHEAAFGTDVGDRLP
jgi:hypothetical protein